MRDYFKVAIKHDVEIEEKTKTIKQFFLFDAVNFTDAETQSNSLIEKETLQEATVETIAKFKCNEVNDHEENLIYFEAIVDEAYENDKGKVQIVKERFLIQSKGITENEVKINDIYNENQIPFTIKSIKDSKIEEFINP